MRGRRLALVYPVGGRPLGFRLDRGVTGGRCQGSSREGPEFGQSSRGGAGGGTSLARLGAQGGLPGLGWGVATAFAVVTVTREAGK